VSTYVKAISEVIQRWCTSVRKYLTGEDGYKILLAVAAAYIGLYKILETRYQNLAAQASSERAALLSSESCDHAEAFISAMKSFAPVQTMMVPSEPNLLKPWTLFSRSAAPNREVLWIWARDLFESCHQDYREDDKTKLRIDLRRANFGRADLHEVDLHGVDLRNVSLRGADLHRANFENANLVGARKYQPL